jgi:hypothetical protein
MIGTPCHGSSVSVGYMRCLLNMINALNAAGLQAELVTTEHDSLVTRARNYIASEFLRQERFTHLLFIDSDIEFPPDAAGRFLKADKDVVCGIYPVKHLNLEKLRSLPVAVPLAEAQAASLDYAVSFKAGAKVDKDGFISVAYAATGFMMIRRRVLMQMAEAMPQLRYGHSFVNAADYGQTNYAFFDTEIDAQTREYLPEDYAFCRRWQSLGGEVHADVFSTFSHVGGFVYAGDLAAYLKHQRNRESG